MDLKVQYKGTGDYGKKSFCTVYKPPKPCKTSLMEQLYKRLKLTIVYTGLFSGACGNNNTPAQNYGLLPAMGFMPGAILHIGTIL